MVIRPRSIRRTSRFVNLVESFVVARLTDGGRRPRPSLLPGLILTGLAGGLTVTPAQAQSRSFHFDISNQSLSQALRSYGHISGQELIYTEEVVAGMTTSLKGDYTAQSALQRLLLGTGLVAQRSPSGAIMIRRPRAGDSATDVGAPISLERAASASPLLVSAADVAAAPDQGGAPAQTAAPAPSSSSADLSGGALEEIVVTGTKRAENIQSVPGSVFVATAAGMERANVRDFDDLVKIAPSLTITKTSQPANNSINIRGIGTYAYSIATEPSVAVVIDDIPQSFQAEAFSALVDVHQVEVLRGPQNTLFGKAASAGVVNITTEPPTDTFTSRVEAMHTNDHEERYQGTVSGPLGSNVKYRLAASFSDFRGTAYNLTTGHWVDGQQDSTVRGKLLWTPGDWKVTFSPYFTHSPASCCTAAPYYLSPGVTFSKNNLPSSLVMNGITPSPNNIYQRLDVDARGDSRDYGTGLKIEHDLGSANVALISSYDRYDLADLQDTDGTDFDFKQLAPTAPHGGSGNGGFFKVSTVTDELRLTSSDQGPFRYVTGFWYSKTVSLRDFVRGSNTLGTYNGLSQLPTSNSTAYSSYISRAWDSNYALYGQSTYDLTSKLGLTTGLRVNHEDISYNFFDRANNVVYGYPDCATKSPTLPISTCNDANSVTGRASLQYHLTQDAMLFGGYSRGYKGIAYDLTSTLTTRTPLTSGPLKGIPIGDAIAAHQPVGAETVNAYEIGWKSSFFDRRLTWNVTLFDEEFQGFQAQSRDEKTNQNILNSIGKVTSRGVEMEWAAAIGRLTLNGGAAYDRARMDHFTNATCFPNQTVAQGCVNNMQDLSGKPLFNAPEWNASLNGEYDFSANFHDWHAFVGGNFHWQSRVVYNLLQDPDSVQKAYALVGATLGVQNDRWKITLFGNNLFDKSYALTRGRGATFNINPAGNPPTDYITWTPARDYSRYFGIRVTANFGE
jgi:iron complex outermembrane receptor protein